MWSFAICIELYLVVYCTAFSIAERTVNVVCVFKKWFAVNKMTNAQ